MVKILKKRVIANGWFTPFAGGSEIGKLISGRTSDGREKDSAAFPSTMALTWILKCCPHLPRSLVQKLFRLRQDRAIVVINKPPGMPVQSGLGINRSLDVLASNYLRYDYEESPRLVHRLDTDCSGILVMGRTKLSASVLHSIFREKTFGASKDTRNLVVNCERTLQKRYCVLAIGSTRRREGLISTPLGKVVVEMADLRELL